jgi:hypothetical protein
LAICLPGRDDPNEAAICLIAMTNEQQAQSRTQSKQNETIFLVRMVGIANEEAVLVQEGRSCFVEGNLMPLDIGGVFVWIPLESKF